MMMASTHFRVEMEKQSPDNGGTFEPNSYGVHKSLAKKQSFGKVFAL
jgi:hypothetical protein